MSAVLPVSPATLRQIENAIFDLQASDYSAFDKPIKKLARLLHSPELHDITASLTFGIDLNAWISAGYATQVGTVGSATLNWPDDQKGELGTIALLNDRFAEKGTDDALNFAHTFYYNGSNGSANLHNLTRQVFVPFARDYIQYVKSETGAAEATMLPPVKTDPAARKVFIVHGHDEGPREMVARYLQKLGFEPIILHEQASRGRTIIEKIEEHSDVGFAVVLLTPDDLGARKPDDLSKLSVSNLQGRARQNVVLELGYFLGKLNRARVCALKRGDVEVPSDFDGVVYVPFDDTGGWKTALGNELQAAGFDIDWNLVMRP